MTDPGVETEWRPTPKFILRSACIDRAIADWAPGRFLEFGAGTGTLTRTFLDRGFTGTCHDITPETRDVLRRNLAGWADAVRVVDDLDAIHGETFEYLFAFEVLEHIEHDLDALQGWTQRLRPGGRLLVSVPAHQRKYGHDDASVGHARRYERHDLEGLLVGAGYEGVEILNYGFPLGNVTRMSQRLMDHMRHRGAGDDRSYVQRSVDSGVRSSSGVLRIAPFVNQRTMAPFVAVQKYFYQRELGDGFVATATKRT